MPTPSVEPAVRSRALPKLSFRAGMIGVTLSVFIAWVGRLAWQGNGVAQVVCLALFSLAAFFLVSVVLFFVAWVPAFLMQRYHDQHRMGNPFAADQLPPQVLPPKGVQQ